MIKYLLFLISTSTIMLLNVLNFEDVDISHNIPDFLVAGSSYSVDVSIQKGDISGFAKFQMEVPDGINVKSVDAKNSSFTFSDGVVKNIWMTIPDDGEINLSYTFEVNANYQGTGTIQAQFVYIKDNERYSVGMKDHPVTVGDDGGVAEVVNETQAAFVPEMIKGHRSVKAINNKDFEVTIKIDKDGLEGFAKIQDELPLGYTAELKLSGESVFSVIDNKIKFIWFNVPAASELTVSYILRSTGELNENARLKGTFNFIYKDDARFIDLPEEDLVIESAIDMAVEEAEEEAIEEAVIEEVIEEAIVAAPIIVKEEAKAEEEVAKDLSASNKEEEAVVDISSPQGGIFYRVQIAAAKNNVKVTYFKNKFMFRGEIYLENHEGWYKYTTGNYDKYVEARNKREEIRTAYKFRGPFVTAYNSGERITVQEALLISKQKWVK